MPTNKTVQVVAVASLAAFASAQGATPGARPRASELGLKVGILPTGPLDAITDVAGVKVGQTTIIRGDNIRTGVTAILPHAGNLYRESKACLDVLRHSSTQQETTAVLVEAERRHSEALKQYVKVLRVFQELVVEGKVPPDEDVD